MLPVSIHKKLIIFVMLPVMMFVSGCAARYDSEKCRTLTDKVLRHDLLDQKEYADMLEQYDCILVYLIDKMDELSKIEDDFKRLEASRRLSEDKEYMERFTYMMTLGSVLYRADVNSQFDIGNKTRYDVINTRANEFARLSELI